MDGDFKRVNSIVSSGAVEAGRIEPDYEPTEVSATYFIPSENFPAETIDWFEMHVRSKGGPYAEPLIETYRIAVHGVLGKMMSDYRALLDRLLKQDNARHRLIKKLTQANLPLPERVEDLTSSKLLDILDDFEHDEKAVLKREHRQGLGVLLGAGALKTAVAYPFFSNVLQGTGFTGTLPTLLGFLLAAAAGALTTGGILLWWRTLNSLLPHKAIDPEILGGSKTAAKSDAKALYLLRTLLRPDRQTHPVVCSLLFVLLSVMMVCLWRYWQPVDFYTLTDHLGVKADVAGVMAKSLVTLLMLAGLVGAVKTVSTDKGCRQVTEFGMIVRQWMEGEITTLYGCEVDEETFHTICSRKDWAAQRILRIGLMVIWSDISQAGTAEEIRDEIIAVKTTGEGHVRRPQQIA